MKCSICGASEGYPLPAECLNCGRDMTEEGAVVCAGCGLAFTLPFALCPRCGLPSDPVVAEQENHPRE